MARIDGILIPSLVFDGQPSTPATPSAGQYRLFVDTGGLLKWVDDAGNVLDPGALNATGKAVNQVVQADGSDGVKFGPAFTVGDTEPVSPSDDDIWFADDGVYRRIGGAWVAISGAPTGDEGIFGGIDMLMEFDARNLTLDNNDPVPEWQDESGNDYHLTQATGANQPTYLAEFVHDTGGFPAVRFENPHRMNTPVISPNIEQPWTIIYVGGPVTIGDNGGLLISPNFDGGYTNKLWWYWRSGSNFAWYSNTDQISKSTTGGLGSHVGVVTYDGASSSWREDGAEVGTGTLTATDLLDGLRINNEPGQAAHGDAAWSILGVVAGVLTTEERDQIETRAAEAFGITLA